MYIIKKHYEATESNQNFAGQVHEWCCGKGGELIAAQDTFPTAYTINEYGYKTLTSAKRGLAAAKRLADWESSHGHWIISVEIVKVDC